MPLSLAGVSATTFHCRAQVSHWSGFFCWGVWASLIAQLVKAGKESACNAGAPGSIPDLGRSPGEGNSYPVQYSGLENSVDRKAWQATVHRVTKSRMRPSGSHFHFSYEENRQVDSIYLEAWQDWDGVTGNSAYLQGIEPSTGKTKFV